MSVSTTPKLPIHPLIYIPIWIAAGFAPIYFRYKLVIPADLTSSVALVLVQLWWVHSAISFLSRIAAPD